MGGAFVTWVQTGSTAERAGLRAGDIIIEVNRGPVTDSQDYRVRLSEAGTAATVLLKVQRGGHSQYMALSR